MRTPSQSPKRTLSSSPIRRELSFSDLSGRMDPMRRSGERLSPLKKSLTYSPTSSYPDTRKNRSPSPLRSRENARLFPGSGSDSSSLRRNSNILKSYTNLSSCDSSNSPSPVNDTFMFFEETDNDRLQVLNEYSAQTRNFANNNKENVSKSVTKVKIKSVKTPRAPFTVLVDYRSVSPTESD